MKGHDATDFQFQIGERLPNESLLLAVRFDPSINRWFVIAYWADNDEWCVWEATAGGHTYEGTYHDVFLDAVEDWRTR